MIIILEQLGIGILGILIYNVFKFQRFLKKDDLKTKVFWSSFWMDSKFTWLWTFAMLLLISITIKVLPESSDAIKALTALDVGTQLVSFFSLGIGLSSLVDTKKA